LGLMLFQASERGELAPEADPVELGEILGGLVMWGILQWAANRTSTASLAGVLQRRTDLFLNGIPRGDS